MEDPDIKNIVAIRKLNVKGSDDNVTVVLGKPQEINNGEDYFCPYQVIGIGKDGVRKAYGVDAIQAIQLAMKKIGAELSSSPQAKIGKLNWDGGEEGDFGFS